jgi:23S rRNA (adenine2503-C2)-methyltransferase
VERLTNLFGLDRDALGSLVAGLGEPAYRARQLYSWLYEKRASSLDEMTDLPRALRERLAAAHVVRWPEVAERAVSADGTVKYLFKLDDGATIESVFIPEERRRTICISTQAGCPLKCAFCLTGIGGYKRNLKPWEILGQVAVVMAESDGGFGGDQKSPPLDEARGIQFRAPKDMPWNIVIMGMGEPLLNYDATVAALRILMDREGFAISPKKLTLSTVGILPALEKLMLEPVRPNLAISLHASNAALRRELMPIEERYGIEEVIAAAQRYPIPSGGMVTYEYVVLGGVNDSPAHARELARLLRGSRGKVNLIPLNPAPEIPFAPPTPEAVDAFCRILSEADVMVSVRRPRGQDILAACGQLHLKREAAPAPVAS